MSGILTDAMKVQMQSGVYQIEQTYLLKIPEDAAKTDYENVTIHDNTTFGVVRVTDHGVMSRSGFNYSVSDPGDLSFGMYRFLCGNGDEYFSRGSSLWEHSVTGYIAEPHECLIVRYCSIKLGGSWTLIPGTFYTGQVDRVEYEQAAMDKPKTILFYCTPVGLEILTARSWGKDDYDEFDLSALTFTGPAPEDN